ncbi:MAG: hypothetical protein BWY97_01469 [Tenericutes bacterium ADurb.BinA124]|nr:MAG: hypothetical protein BWY97_01469 [Tenericutes bacterium ADurb.BinA124]
MKKVLFVSNLKKCDDNMSSTDIMTFNIIKGLNEGNVHLDLFALYDDEKEVEQLLFQYSQYCKKMHFAKRRLHEGQSKYYSTICSLLYQWNTNYYFNEIKKSKITDSYDLIICNKITIDEIVFGKVLKRVTKSSKLFEFWSDPMALAGINKDLFKKTPRKWLFKIIEKKALRNCDRIIYGTKVLMLTQKEFYKKESVKMSYIDIAYCENAYETEPCCNSKKIIYAGNYYSTIRNILELVQAISKQNEFTLDVFGDSDLDLTGFNNVFAHGRIPKAKLDVVKNDYSIEVCLLNKITPQIPGKIFYDMLSEKIIIILADGPMQNEIIDYLSKYKRFLVCKNRFEDISKLLSTQLNNSANYDFEYLKNNFSPMVVSKSLIDGGMV